MKKVIFTLMISLLMTNNVFAETHDVKAKYEKNYNVDVNTITLNNNTKNIQLDEYKITLSTTLKNVELVLIKPEENINNYIKTVTNNISNYYIMFYKDGKKINNNNINVEFKHLGKKLKVYDTNGNQLEENNNIINLTSNDYYLTINNVLTEIRDNYKIIDVNTLAEDLKNGTTTTPETNIQIFNSKNELIEDTKTLGTGYKVIIENQGETIEHQIVVKGDTTGDAKINLNDITRLYHYYKLIEQMNDAYILAGDVATNDTINLNDITKLYHYHKDLISDL